METSFQLPKIGQLVREAWKIYVGKFGILLTLTLPFLVWSIVNINFIREKHAIYVTATSFLVFFIIAVFTQAALFGNLTNNGSFSFALKTFPKYLWTSILAALIITTGLFMLIIPGIIWIFWFTFSVPIIADEGISGMQPLLKSREYMRGRTLQIFGKLFAFGFILIIPSIVLSLFAKHYPLLVYIQSIYNALVLPISSAYLYNLYQHIKSNQLVMNPLGPGTGFKISAWVGMIIMIGLVVLGILLAKVLIPKLEHLKDLRNTNYTISPADVSDIPDGQILSDYVITQLKRGVSENDIRSLLAKTGWELKYIDQVFRSIKIQK